MQLALKYCAPCPGQEIMLQCMITFLQVCYSCNLVKGPSCKATSWVSNGAAEENSVLKRQAWACTAGHAAIRHSLLMKELIVATE